MGKTEGGTGLPEEKVVRTVCQDCHDGCGVLVHVKDGKLVKIEGDPEHPLTEGMMCPKGLSLKQFIYHPDRLKYPMKRVGERGEGKWQRISWDEALDTIATKLAEIKEKYGPCSILAIMGGKPTKLQHALWGLTSSLGSPNVTWTDAPFCFGPTPIAAMYTHGGLLGWERSSDVKNSNCILLWGGHPIYAHPPQGRLIWQARARGAKLIVVDPKLTPTASKADLWLQIRPGTDDGLALSMLNVIINEELYDKEFVDKWCIGFEELKERVQEYPPEKMAEVTWLAVDDIIKAARMFATIKPAVLHDCLAVEQITNPTQTNRAICILRAITGNIDVKGGNVYKTTIPGAIPYYFHYWEGYRVPDEVAEKRLGAKEYPLLSGPKSPMGLVHPPTMIQALLTDKPYPIKAWIVYNNVLLCLPNSRDVYQALKRVEFLVVDEFFMTPTAELADILLPAAHWLERDDIAALYNNYDVCAPKVIEPVGECWDEMKVTFELLKRMGVKFRWAPVESDREFLDWRLKGAGMTFEDLKRKYIVTAPIPYKRYEKRGFLTPAGKVELYSNTFKEFGYDPLPHYVEPVESPISTPELAKEYPFILIAIGVHIGYMHSMGRGIPWLRELAPDPLIQIHPQTASELGIKDGDWVWLEVPSSKERIKRRAKLTAALHPKVVQCNAHWWFPEKPAPDHGHWEVNINKLLDGSGRGDPIAGTTPLTGLLCKIYRAEEG